MNATVLYIIHVIIIQWPLNPLISAISKTTRLNRLSGLKRSSSTLHNIRKICLYKRHEIWPEPLNTIAANCFMLKINVSLRSVFVEFSLNHLWKLILPTSEQIWLQFFFSSQCGKDWNMWCKNKIIFDETVENFSLSALQNLVCVDNRDSYCEIR